MYIVVVMLTLHSGKGVPYYINVSAVTGGGEGPTSQKVNFTMQGGTTVLSVCSLAL